jgi:hypothetical protein
VIIIDDYDLVFNDILGEYLEMPNNLKLSRIQNMLTFYKDLFKLLQIHMKNKHIYKVILAGHYDILLKNLDLKLTTDNMNDLTPYFGITREMLAVKHTKQQIRTVEESHLSYLTNDNIQMFNPVVVRDILSGQFSEKSIQKLIDNDLVVNYFKKFEVFIRDESLGNGLKSWMVYENIRLPSKENMLLQSIITAIYPDKIRVVYPILSVIKGKNTLPYRKLLKSIYYANQTQINHTNQRTPSVDIIKRHEF